MEAIPIRMSRVIRLRLNFLVHMQWCVCVGLKKKCQIQNAKIRLI